MIAFQSAVPLPAPDEPHAVKVRVKRDGLRLFHRTAYVLSKPDTDEAVGGIAAAEAIAKGLSGGPVPLRLTAMPDRDYHGAAIIPAVLHVDGETRAVAARGGKLPVQVYGYSWPTERSWTVRIS